MQHTPRLIGHSLHCSEYHKALDPHTLTRVVQHNELVVLNAWHMKDPCTNYTRTGNSQIDFIMVRVLSADPFSKQVIKQAAPFGAWKEITHQALIANIRVIRYFHLPRPAQQLNASYAVKELDHAYRRNDPKIQVLQNQIQQRLASIETPAAELLNQVLHGERSSRYQTGRGGVTSLPTQVYHMWQRRKDLLKSRLYDASGIIRAWKWLVLYIKAGR